MMRLLPMRLLPMLLLPSALLTLPALAGAQPWRYEKNGAVYYTNNVNDLPPKQKARILAERAAEAEAKAAEAEAKAAAEAGIGPPIESRSPAAAPPAPPSPALPQSRPGRIKGAPARPAGSPTPRAAPPAPPPTPVTPDADETPAAKRARLEAELTAARAALHTARRQAILVPDGRSYAARIAAEEHVAALEAELAALGR